MIDNSTTNETRHMPTLHITLPTKHKEAQQSNEILHIPALAMLQGTNETKHGLVEHHVRGALQHEETTRHIAVMAPTMPSRVTSAYGLVSQYRAMEQQCVTDAPQLARGAMYGVCRAMLVASLIGLFMMIVVALLVGSGLLVIGGM